MGYLVRNMSNYLIYICIYRYRYKHSLKEHITFTEILIFLYFTCCLIYKTFCTIYVIFGSLYVYICISTVLKSITFIDIM